MTPYNVAKRVELDAAQAMQEAWVERDLEKYRLATEWHLRCVTHRIVAELAERRAAS